MNRDLPNTSGDYRPAATLAVLEQRAALLRKLRAFFDGLGFIEVETPLLSTEIIPEEHIEPFEVETPRGIHWLQASPEAHMKRLLAAGARKIYQVTRSFRQGDCGAYHNAEFTIVEWYRTGDDMAAGMVLLDDLCQAMLGAPPAVRTSYRDAFLRFARIDPLTATEEQLNEVCAALAKGESEISACSRDDCLNFLLVRLVEPNLGQATPEILYDYPASQAALAKVRNTPGEPPVAERFELYWRGVELANGYHELTDAKELQTRIEKTNTARKLAGNAPIPQPTRLLAAMEDGLPNCSGVALGFDRLVMLAVGAKTIGEVLAFPTDRA